MVKDLTYITLRRSITKWEWYKDSNTARLFFHLLLTANHKDGTVRGRTVLRGQTLTSCDQLASELLLTNKQIRVALDHLKSTKNIQTKRAGKGLLVTVENYSFYQSEECIRGRERGAKRATNNKYNNNNICPDAAEGGEDGITEQAKSVVDYFNEKCGTRHKYSKTTLTPIKARLKDYTVDDCKAVIDDKVEKWSGDKKMSEYLRPSTLFAAKHFEDYLNQALKQKVEDKPSVTEEQLLAINWED